MNNSTSLSDFLTNDLNSQQQRAVKPQKGILLVRAGAGSGKTRVITARMLNLIYNYQVIPNNIVALTFTNKAAQEMKDRIKKYLGSNFELPFVGTFHSFALKFLKQNSYLLPFGNFSLLDENDQLKLAKDIINEADISKKISAYQLLSQISNIKNNYAYINGDYNKLLQPFIAELYKIYETKKNISRCFDFDDLLLWTVKLLDTNNELKIRTQENIKHILVDEYQDTNQIQHALLKLLSLNKNKFILDSLCVVGDEDQSIYSWRGATISNILNFGNDFKNTDIITIEKNYRSVQPILSIANAVISNNKLRSPKNLCSDKQASNRIQIIECISSKQEADIIAYFLTQAIKIISLKDVAILYRSHFQSRNIEEALIRNSIPYKIIGGIQFYNRQEIKDILSYLKLIVNQYDRVAFSRVINIPARGLGPKFEELFYQEWDKQPFLNFKQVCLKLVEESIITGTKAQSVLKFLEIFENLTPNSKASDAINKILKITDYMQHLNNTEDVIENAQTRKDNVKELLNSTIYFEQTEEKNLDKFLEDVSLLQEQTIGKESSNDCVKLMTFHAAKGLEFNTVLLVGCEDGILPSSRSYENIESIEEERRLLYVGITRACERLLITYSRYRFTYGQPTDQQPSRFLAEIPSKYAIHFDSSYWKEFQIKSHFKNWLENNFNNLELPKTAKQAVKLNTQKNIGNKLNFNKSAEFPNTNWILYKSVQHQKFGLGIIQAIEIKHQKTYLTVRFNCGIKKIESSFVK